MTNIFNKVIKFSLYLLVFLLPIFWLPFSFEAFEFNKQYLLFFLVSVAFFAWLAKMVLVDKEIRFRRTPLDILVLIFLLVAILSAVFSVDRVASVLGFYGRFSDGLIGLLGLGILYFLITNNVRDVIKGELKVSKGELKEGEIPNPNDQANPIVSKTKVFEKLESQIPNITVQGLLRVFLWSIFFVILTSYFSIFGIWTKINTLLSGKFTLPPIMTSPFFNPASGSLEGLAIFLSIILVLLVGLLLSRAQKDGKIGAFWYYLLLISALGLEIIIDYRAAWLVLFLSLFIFVVLALGKRLFRENVNRLLLPILLFIVALIFLFTGISNLAKQQLPQEQVLDQKTGWQISLKTVTNNVKFGFLGSGIGSEQYDFAKFKPVEFNQSALWQIRFDRPGSHFAEILATMGFLGLISYLMLVVLFLLVSWFLLKDVKGELKSSKRIQFSILMVFAALVISQFVYYQNSVLAFTFWTFLALGVLSWQKPISEKKFSFKDFPELNLVLTVVLICLGAALLGGYYFGQQFYRADANELQALKLFPGPEQTALLEKAVRLNPERSQYLTTLAGAYLSEAISEMAKPSEQIDQSRLQTLAAKAIEAGKTATAKGQNQVTNWETLGMIYRDILKYWQAGGAEEWALKSFEKAIELEPTNPVLRTELGKLLVINEPEKAKEEFAKAMKLKPDYFDIEANFQLGRLYFNDNKIDEAISQFKKVISVFPNHSNSLYALGLAEQKKGMKEEAISAFEKVLELNPGNPDMVKKLEELKR
ncbi:tetratricopeptide repeat protein [Patescibacteria group bacterium]|nr:tetratricopeptide repeat protein [Patescibacteria group bacterium]